MYKTVLHTNNVAEGGKLSFQNVGGGKGVYNVLTFQKSTGGKSSPGGGQMPPPPVNETLIRAKFRKVTKNRHLSREHDVGM